MLFQIWEGEREMKKLSILILVLSILNITANASHSAQNWANAYYGRRGSDLAKSIQQTSDGGYIVAGSTGSFGDSLANYWVLKLDASGNVSWQNTYGGSGLDYAASIEQTSDGGYIVAGNTWSFGAGSSNVWILKLESNGDVSWQRTYGGTNGEGANSIQQTTDGGYIVAGSTSSLLFIPLL